MKALRKTGAFTTLSFFLAACSSGISEFDKQAVVATVSCRDIDDDAERLACLDNASNQLAKTLIVRENADGTREPYFGEYDLTVGAAPEVEEESKTRKQAEDEFGSERIKAAQARQEKERPQSINVQISEIIVDPYNKVTVTLENGQVWRQLAGDDRTVRFPSPHQIYTAEIKRGVFGNYFMKIIERDRTIRVRRIQ
ncbi:MAG: hypothetical protein AAF936_03580 [Pseudomonadota bacterium]